MIFKLRDKIFGLFGAPAKAYDTYKDVQNKGIWERYNESLGALYDDELSDLIDNFADNTIVPGKMLSELIGHMEDSLGSPIIVRNVVATRRKIIRFAEYIYKVRSTKTGYTMLLRMLGFATVNIIEYTHISGFDSDLTLDDENRRFDGGRRTCKEYTLELTGSIGITQDIYNAVLRIIEFEEPIYAELRAVTYNGDELVVEGSIFDETFDDTFE